MLMRMSVKRESSTEGTPTAIVEEIKEVGGDEYVRDRTGERERERKGEKKWFSGVTKDLYFVVHLWWSFWKRLQVLRCMQTFSI